MKEKLIKLAEEKGFIGVYTLPQNDTQYYLWMCELALWFRTKHDILVYVSDYLPNEGEVGKSYQSTILYDWCEESSDDYIYYQSYNEAFEDGLICAFSVIKNV